MPTLYLRENPDSPLRHDGPVYRFFEQESEADALVSGNVWISTLETCRNYEDPKQGDKEEARHLYNSGLAVGGSGEPGFAEIARRSGFTIGPNCNSVWLEDITYVSVIPDAYVLCTTIEFSPNELGDTFGTYCVKILDPKQFLLTVTKYLDQVVPIKKFMAGKVLYGARNYSGLDKPLSGPLGFVKPPDDYTEQQEFRFLWIPEANEKIKPFLLKCPEVRNFCQRISGGGGIK